MEKTETTEMKKGQRKRQMDKESGIDAERGTQERRYEGEGTSKKEKEDGKN
jgi:hypothetical protein